MTTQEAARLLLPGVLSDHSEDLWCAQWLVGCEYRLWQWAHSGDEDLTLLPEQKAVLRWLSEAAGGWFWWPNDDDTVEELPRFIGAAEWAAEYARWWEERTRAVERVMVAAALKAGAH